MCNCLIEMLVILYYLTVSGLIILSQIDAVRHQ